MTRGAEGAGESDEGIEPPVVNTHVHLPPNFSAFDRVTGVIDRAVREGVAVVGASNYSDFRIYRGFAEAASHAGVLPLFGLEIISLQEDLQAEGILVNDPENPGRTYLCGKAITGFDRPNAAAAELVDRTRRLSDERIAGMIERLAACFREAGLELDAGPASIADEVAARNGVPAEWVALQERHVARSFQEALFRELPVQARGPFLDRLLGDGPWKADDGMAVQDALRGRLMKAGRRAFVAEASVPFDEARRMILELGGIPCYPTLADGAIPICRFEDPPRALADRLLALGIHSAELIPTRNHPEVVDRYVATFRSAGIIVTAGTEHNTQRIIPLAPTCLGGAPLSPQSRAVFWEGTCVVAAHQELGFSGREGYVDRDGRLAPGFADGEARIRWFRELGEQVIGAASQSRSVA